MVNWADYDPEELQTRLDKMMRRVEVLPITYQDGPVIIFNPAVTDAPDPEWPDVVLEDILDAELIGE